MPGALTVAAYMNQNSSWRRLVKIPLVVDIGGTGAPTVNATLSATGFTVTRGIAGTYTGTMPFGARALVESAYVIKGTQYAGANQELSQVAPGAIDGPGGTFAFVTLAQGPADAEGQFSVADLASGDRLVLWFAIEGG